LGADSDADSDFVDNDYEIDIDDDDLFDQNVDEEANTKGKDVCIQEELEEDNGEDVVGSTHLNLPTTDTNAETMNFNLELSGQMLT